MHFKILQVFWAFCLVVVFLFFLGRKETFLKTLIYHILVFFQIKYFDFFNAYDFIVDFAICSDGIFVS